ncbi:MAG: hypothetical protein ACJA1F_001246 [Paracoccaceae bacterium]|jgi:hypothetical protein
MTSTDTLSGLNGPIMPQNPVRAARMPHCSPIYSAL